jgi:hypothetical protein
MPKFDVTILYTVTYSHIVEIEAETEAGAEAKANEIFKNADPIAHWEYDGGELDMDIWEVEEER